MTLVGACSGRAPFPNARSVSLRFSGDDAVVVLKGRGRELAGRICRGRSMPSFCQTIPDLNEFCFELKGVC